MKKINLKKMIWCPFLFMLLAVIIVGFTACVNEDHTLKNGVLKVAVEEDFMPYSYYDDDGNIIGENVDYIKMIAQKAGYEVEIVPMPFSDILDEVWKHKKVDIAISEITITEKREEKVDFTIGYAYENVGLFTKASTGNTLDSLINKAQSQLVKVACTEGTYFQDMQYELGKYVEIVTYSTNKECSEALLNEEVDAVWDDYNTKDTYKSGEIVSFRLSEEGFGYDIGIALSKDLKNVKEKLDYAIINWGRRVN